ncbi:MAG TPA: inositol monophosphatase family protein [Candidatus Limnocylindrales bacterium]|jgi:myo-inositol-1(or 4)-monophosphatase
MTTHAAELDLAVGAARGAGAIQLERYERLERIVHKGPRDVVTEVDHLCEALILDAIRSRFPDDAIVAEESGEHRSRRGKGAHASEGAGRAWVVDPLDGTVNYANGVPIFCVSIAFVLDGRPTVGVIYDPLRDELFSAVAGQGARLDGRRIHLPDKERLEDCLVSLAMPWRGYRHREAAVRRVTRVSRTLGSSALALAYLGNGRFDIFVQLRSLSNWDVAAAGLIAEEGGAVLTDGAGGAWYDAGRRSRGVSIIGASVRHQPTVLDLVR